MDRSRTSETDAVLNAFSIDVEDYFQVTAFEDFVDRGTWDRFEHRVENNTYLLLDLLDEFGVKGTFFVLGWVAERWPGLAKEIHARGHELASHGYDHQRVTSQTPEGFRRDLRKSRRLLEDSAGVEVIGYRAPSYSVVRRTLWALDILLEEGFRYDSSVFPIVHDRYGIPDFPRFPGPVRQLDGVELVEFPVSTVRLGGMNLPFIGGGYLRLFPMWFILWGVRQLNLRECKPVIAYVHPWELDPQQPRQPASWANRIRHYRNLHLTESRLRDLFQKFRFGTVREVLGL